MFTAGTKFNEQKREKKMEKIYYTITNLFVAYLLY